MRKSKIALLHIPKTGGTQLAERIVEQTAGDPHYFFTFGPAFDSSQGANRMLVENLHKGDYDYHLLLQNKHFLESRVISGHFSYDLRNILDDFSFEFATVVREPIGRCISHINQLTRTFPTGERFGAFDVPTRATDPDRYWRTIGSILTQYRGQEIPGLNPRRSMLLTNGMCRLIAGAQLDTYTPDVDVDRALANLPAFKVAVFEEFNASCGAMLRSLGIPVVLDDHTNRRGAGYPPIYTGHPLNYGAPEDIIELVRSMNEDDIYLYRAASRLCAEQRQLAPATDSTVSARPELRGKTV